MDTLVSTGRGDAVTNAAASSIKQILENCILGIYRWKLRDRMDFFSGALGSRSLFADIKMVRLGLQWGG